MNSSGEGVELPVLHKLLRQLRMLAAITPHLSKSTLYACQPTLQPPPPPKQVFTQLALRFFVLYEQSNTTCWSGGHAAHNLLITPDRP